MMRRRRHKRWRPKKHSHRRIRLRDFKRPLLTSLAIGVVVFVTWIATRPSQPVYQGRKLMEWIMVLESSNEDEEAQAMAAIEAMGAKALPTILRLLGNKESEKLRMKAKYALILSGPESMHASIPSLISLSQNAHAGIRLSAVELLSQMIYKEPTAVPALLSAQRDSDAQVRKEARRTIGEYRRGTHATGRSHWDTHEQGAGTSANKLKHPIKVQSLKTERNFLLFEKCQLIKTGGMKSKRPSPAFGFIFSPSQFPRINSRDFGVGRFSSTSDRELVACS